MSDQFQVGAKMSTDDALKDALKQVAQAKVAEALGGDVLGKMVEAVMSHRPKSYGSSRDNPTEFERIVSENIVRLIEDAVQARLVEHGATIKAAVASAMGGHVDKMATKVIDAFVGEDWRARLHIEIVHRKDDE